MTENGQGDNEWGWEPLESEDESTPNLSNSRRSQSDENPDVSQSDELKTSKSNSNKNNSSKVQIVDIKQNFVHNNVVSMKKGITSSPSFQELERAIGEMVISNNDDSDAKSGQIATSNSNPNLNSLAQHKLQRFRQKQQYQQYSSPIQIPNIPSLHQNTRAELSIFTNETDSRAIILFHSPLINVTTVRDACQKFGVLYYIRPEFHSKGVTLLCYFDLRSAVRAKTSLASEFGEEAEASAHYSIQLHASNSSSEEFRLVVDNIPSHHTSSDVEAIFSRYGQLRSFEKHIDENAKESVGVQDVIKNTYLVEFFNIQDARLAASELSATSSQIWDESVTIVFAPLDSRKQQLCRMMLMTMSKWRSELTNYGYSLSPTSPRYVQWQQQMYQGNLNNLNNHNANVMFNQNYNQMSMQPIQMMYTYPVQATPAAAMYQTNSTVPYINMSNQLGNNQLMNIPSQMPLPQPLPQSYMSYDNKLEMPTHNLELQKNSNYMQQIQTSNYQVVTPSQYRDQYSQQIHLQQQQQQRLQYQNRLTNPAVTAPGPASKYHHANVNNPNLAHHQSNAAAVSFPPSLDAARPHHHNGGHGHNTRTRSSYTTSNTSVNSTRPVVNNSNSNGHNNNNNMISNVYPQNLHSNLQSAAAVSVASTDTVNQSSQIDSEFTLDFEKLIDGKETRTTVMVRNIPNKYNQVMLLDEVNVSHQWTYDFFYLPIDFKNRCNVGYCFINFLEPQFILPFVREFNGQRWKSFNSEKVCTISFARIQGKAAMISRFQNSSLLDKDDEYQPLLFYSSGELKGQPEPFPNNNRTRQQQQQLHHHVQQQQQQQQINNSYIEN